MKVRFSVFVATLVVSLVAQAATRGQLLVISDIDDTLRPTHRIGADFFEQYANVADTLKNVTGMSSVFHSLDQSGAEIHYVTAAPNALLKFANGFLKDSNFPQAEHVYNKADANEATEDFKAKKIQEIINQVKPDRILLVGDNGEKDIPAYVTIAANNANVTVFIHKLYENAEAVPVPADQGLYLTGADFAAQLEALGLITSEQALAAIAEVAKGQQAGDDYSLEKVLPAWAEITLQDIERSFGSYKGAADVSQALADVRARLVPLPLTLSLAL